MESQFNVENQHPKLILDLIIQKYGLDLTFEFSIYNDLPGATDSDRRLFRVSARQITDTFIARTIEDLPEGRELALNSRVLTSVGGEKFHIPMVDFSTVALAQTEKLSSVLPNDCFGNMMWFKSGRSFHGYGLLLIEHGQWIELMGRLLLVNRPGYPAIVDPRWIGHRLIAGYSALRWSRNTSKYLHIPTLATHSVKKPWHKPGRAKKKSSVSG